MTRDNFTNDISLSIIVPVFNEERILAKTIAEFNNYFLNFGSNTELIVINDGSTDRSPDIIGTGLQGNYSLKIINNAARRGKALSVKNGIMAAEGRYVLFMDADLAVPLKEISKILKYTENDIDIIMGIRDEMDKDTVIARPLHRKIVTKIYNKICNILFFKNKIVDVGCGFKMFKKEIAKDLFLNLYIKSWVFDVELVTKAINNDYKIMQVPVDWIYNGHTHVNIYKDLIFASCELIRLKLHLKNKHVMHEKKASH